jgi:NIPSNAP
MACPIVELRQYTLHPGQRDVLIELFDREFVETQEACGMTVLGQFRDLDRPEVFVWLRGFDDMPSRAESLQRFYTGPVWKSHAAAANATMVDSDDVLLLRPATSRPGLALTGARPAVGSREPSSVLLANILLLPTPADATFEAHFDSAVRPGLCDAGGAPIACLRTEYAENTFPALPVRSGEHAFVWLSRFTELSALTAHCGRIGPVVSKLPGVLQHLRLAPTGRSWLR